MAREQLMSEYEQRREQIHKKWEIENEQSWKTNRIFLPYPDEMLAFPTDGEVIARAKLIQDFIEQSYATEEEPAITLAQAIAAPVDPEAILNQPAEEEPAPHNEPIEETEPALTPVTEEKPEDRDWVRDPVAIQEYAATMARAKMEDESSSTSKILPDLVKTLEQLRNNWRKPQ